MGNPTSTCNGIRRTQSPLIRRTHRLQSSSTVLSSRIWKTNHTRQTHRIGNETPKPTLPERQQNHRYHLGKGMPRIGSRIHSHSRQSFKQARPKTTQNGSPHPMGKKTQGTNIFRTQEKQEIQRRNQSRKDYPRSLHRHWMDVPKEHLSTIENHRQIWSTRQTNPSNPLAHCTRITRQREPHSFLLRIPSRSSQKRMDRSTQKLLSSGRNQRTIHGSTTCRLYSSYSPRIHRNCMVRPIQRFHISTHQIKERSL